MDGPRSKSTEKISGTFACDSCCSRLVVIAASYGSDAEKQRAIGVHREMHRAEVILADVGDELLEDGIIGVVIAHDPAHLDHLTDLLFERQALERSIRPALLRASRGADRVWLQGLVFPV